MTASPARPDRALRSRRLLPWVVFATALLSVVVGGATAAHVVQMWRAMQADAEARTGTLARILAKDLNRNLTSIHLLFDVLSPALEGRMASADAEGVGAILSSEVAENALVRQLSLVSPGGRILASSQPTAVGADAGLETSGKGLSDRRIHVAGPREGRSLPGGAGRGAAFARSGFLVLYRSTAPGPDAPYLVAVVGADSLLNHLRELVGDDPSALAVHAYDGRLLATDSEALLAPRPGNPLFARFVPEREHGAFQDHLADGSAWFAHFDTADDFPLIVEVRYPRAVVVDRWRRELLEPLGLMGLLLAVVAASGWLVHRSLRQQDAAFRRLRTQERRLRNILDTAADGIVTIDARGVIREYNRAAEAIFRTPAGDAIGRPLTDLLPPELAGHQAYLERYLSTGKATIVGHGRMVETRRRDGTPMSVHLAVSELEDGGQRYFTGIVRDMTEMRQAEQRFSTLFQRSGEPHLLFGENGLLDCNEAALALLGEESHASLRGARLVDMAEPVQGPAGASAASVLRDAEAAARRDGTSRREWLVRTVDGHAHPVEMTLTPIRLSDQDAMLVSWHDIAERQQHERDLRDARDAAESAARAKSNFLAVMSHELRTPMTGILGMIDLLETSPLSEEQERFVGALGSSARGLLRILNDVLDYSKMEAGRLEIERIPFHPGDVAREVVDLLAYAASMRGNSLRGSWDAARLPRLMGDPTRLRQVLTNLVSNAVKFTERGTVMLSMDVRSVGEDGVELLVDVRDTGVGIPADVVPHLFRPFQQADSSTTRRFGGTGLGLAICRRIVEAMGGEISVESEPGQGSVFHVRLRMTRAPSELAAEPRLAPDSPGSRPAASLRILVAEDNPVNRLLLGTRLRRDGHAVTLVDDGRQAVEAVQDGHFDVVLMDMQMPGLDGVGATREIRRLGGELGRIPIVALTADALPGFREAYLGAGLDDYLTKPVDWVSLDAVLARVAAHRRVGVVA